MRILIIDNDYPSDKNLYGDVFVHVRVKEYRKRHECLVLSITQSEDYSFEGVSVKGAGTIGNANKLIAQFTPDLIVIHFALREIIREIIPLHQVPYIIWVHGYEALSWYRRRFNYRPGLYFSRAFFNMVMANRRQLASVASLIGLANKSGKLSFVFVSQWMKQVCEADTGARISRFHIIPNPIDVHFFRYVPKTEGLRSRVLMIRPFTTRKYATDIAVDAICRLADHPSFSRFHFTVVGEGTYFPEDSSRLSRYTNVTLINRFMNHEEIRAQHAEHGIFLCPTRQDAQGVSMCEAMSSGLVPITSLNTAIPEYVTEGVSGFLTTNSRGIADRLLELLNDPHLFMKMSSAAAAQIRAHCSLENIIPRELQIFENRG